MEDHDLVPSLSHNIESHTHSRVPECDGRPSIQVKPSAVNRMVTASTGVQTDLPKVVHTSCRLICHSSEPQTSTVRISCPRPKALNRDPTATSGVNDSSQTVPQLCVPHQSTASQPPRLVSRSGQLQEQGFSVEVA